jgi:hypothetical protein
VRPVCCRVDGAVWCNHEGSYGGFRTYNTKDMGTGVAVIVLSNFAEAESDKLGDAIAESLGGDESAVDEDEEEGDEEDEETKKTRRRRC